MENDLKLKSELNSTVSKLKSYITRKPMRLSDYFPMGNYDKLNSTIKHGEYATSPDILKNKTFRKTNKFRSRAKDVFSRPSTTAGTMKTKTLHEKSQSLGSSYQSRVVTSSSLLNSYIKHKKD